LNKKKKTFLTAIIIWVSISVMYVLYVKWNNAKTICK